MIEARGLSKFYGATRAIEDISFEVPQGVVMGFLGPNGAGKSTTMRILTCFTPPSAGSASVAGFDIVRDTRPEAISEERKTVGRVPAPDNVGQETRHACNKIEVSRFSSGQAGLGTRPTFL